MSADPWYCFEDGEHRKVLFNPIKRTGFVPEKGSEIFVSAIPPDATVSELLGFFEEIGILYQVKLMTRPESDNKSNRGFGFVTYMNRNDAEKALKTLPRKPFRDDRVLLSIRKSLENCRIFVGGVPQDRSKSEIWKELVNLYKLHNIVDVITYRNYSDMSRNRGFVFVEFRNHEEASNFRAKYAEKLILFGRKMLVDWAIPVMNVPEDALARVKILFVRNLDVKLTPKYFSNVIHQLINKKHVEKIYKFKDFSYIHLDTREHAEFLRAKLTEYFKNTVVEISFAKPPNQFTDKKFRDTELFVRKLRLKLKSSSSSSSSPSPPPPSSVSEPEAISSSSSSVFSGALDLTMTPNLQPGPSHQYSAIPFLEKETFPLNQPDFGAPIGASAMPVKAFDLGFQPEPDNNCQLPGSSPLAKDILSLHQGNIQGFGASGMTITASDPSFEPRRCHRPCDPLSPALPSLRSERFTLLPPQEKQSVNFINNAEALQEALQQKLTAAYLDFIFSLPTFNKLN